ncbi:MAG: hypothetical protein K8R53_15790, partial [Bacteroidales bacterium]|nr:hypothetical protein [Bacteroidales bacterium]
MTRSFTILVLLLAGFLTAMAQQAPTVDWRFANPIVTTEASDMYLVFDVEISCDQSATYHSDLQIYIDYNSTAFGNNITANGNIAFERLELLQGDIG